MRRVTPLLIALLWVAVAVPDALGANHTAFSDKGGDACCTEDIGRVVVSNDDTGTITFAVTAPEGPEGGVASDRFIEIDTERGTFIIGTNPVGEGYALWQGAATVMRGRIEAAHHGDVFRFVVDRHRLGDTNRFTFGVSFWSITSLGGANHDDAPDAGKWSYRMKLALGAVRPVLSVRQNGVGGSRLSAGLALRLGQSDQLLASGTIVCAAAVRGQHLRVLRSEFVARRAVCVWEVPRWARGKAVRGVVGVRVTDQRSSLRRRTFHRLLT
jgi:hypothetical protein